MKPRKSRKAVASPEGEAKGEGKPERILFFDIVRIVCIAFIVYDHSRIVFLSGINQLFFASGYLPLNFYTNGLQGWAVYGMIFVSGAVLEYNYRGLERLSRYGQFLFRRLLRLYPVFWISLIFGIILGILLTPAFLLQHIPGVLFEFTGFYVVLGQGPGLVNLMGWFIAAIVCLYLLYPWLSRLVSRYQLAAIAGLCLVSWGARSLVLTYNIIPLDQFWRWFPLFNAFEFCLGIYIVQKGWFPKKANTSRIIRLLADLSFYVFLFHTLVIGVLLHLISPSNWLVMLDNAIAMNNLAAGYALYYIETMAAVLIVSWIAMKVDIRIQRWILRQDRVKKFLAAG